MVNHRDTHTAFLLICLQLFCLTLSGAGIQTSYNVNDILTISAGCIWVIPIKASSTLGCRSCGRNSKQENAENLGEHLHCDCLRVLEIVNRVSQARKPVPSILWSCESNMLENTNRTLNSCFIFLVKIEK